MMLCLTKETTLLERKAVEYPPRRILPNAFDRRCKLLDDLLTSLWNKFWRVLQGLYAGASACHMLLVNTKQIGPGALGY